MNFETIEILCRSFLSPLVPFLEDSTVNEIMCKGSGPVLVERAGARERVDCLIEEDELLFAAQQVARLVCGTDLTTILSARLPDHSRFSVVCHPASQPTSTLTIRKFQMERFDLAELTRVGTVSEEAASLLVSAVKDRANILFSGQPGTGKTTLLNALTDYIDPAEHVIVIEDTCELRPRLPVVTRFEERPEVPGIQRVSARDLLRAALRHSCNRILLGEIRDGAAFEFLQAMNTGTQGSMSTIHANTAELALDRLATCCLMAEGVSLPFASIRMAIGTTLGYVVQLANRGRLRTVDEIIRVGVDRAAGSISTKTVYRRAA